MEWAKLCEPHHLIIIILVLLVALISTGAGKGVGSLLGPIIKRIFGKGEVTVNVGQMGEEMGRHSEKGEFCAIDPKNCRAHQAEYDRSQRNKDDIAQLKQSFEIFKTKFFEKLESIEAGITEIKIGMVRLQK